MTLRCTTSAGVTTVSAVTLGADSDISDVKIPRPTSGKTALLPAITVCNLEKFYETLPQVHQMVILITEGGLEAAGTALLTSIWNSIVLSGGTISSGTATVSVITP